MPHAAPSLVWKSRPVFVSSTFRDMHAERDWLRNHAFSSLADRLRERSHYFDAIDLRQGVESASETDEAVREIRVLKVCLDEIERSKPFLVALLGDRYGWVPSPERIEAAARSAGLPQTVGVRGHSVTELEILYGILENADQRRRSHVYLRTVDRTDMPPEVAKNFPSEIPDDDPDSPAGRLRDLKARLRRELPGRVRDYTLSWDAEKRAVVGYEALDALVESDLWADLDAETAAYLRQAPRTWQEADARAVADFASECGRSYVERPAATDPMLALALCSCTAGATHPLPHSQTDNGLAASSVPDAEWGLVVTGESGCGKSSLFGRVYDVLQPGNEKGGILLLSHASGIFPQSGSVDRMLKRWIAELAAFLQIPDPIAELEIKPSENARFAAPNSLRSTPGVQAATAEQIDTAFASLLGQAAGRIRVVVLVDALNQFENTVRAQHLTWLPKLWPANAVFLATAIPCDASAALAARPGCRELPVPAVTEPEAREIARRYCRERFHRDIDPLVLNALLSKAVQRSALSSDLRPRTSDLSPTYSNPLWLSLALQEMNLLEADDYERADREYAKLPGAERMRRLQLDTAARLPADASGLYGELVARAERSFGKAWADAFVDLVAVSRSGWRESDFEALMPAVSRQPWEILAFAGLRRVFGPHVVQRGAYAQWDFFHTALRDTVLRRNLSDEAARKRLHGEIAQHFDAQTFDDPLKRSETLFHLLNADDKERASSFLATARIGSSMTRQAKFEECLSSAVDVLITHLCAAENSEQLHARTKWIVCLAQKGEDWQRMDVFGFIKELRCALQYCGGSMAKEANRILLTANHEAIEAMQSRYDDSQGVALTYCTDLLARFKLSFEANDSDEALDVCQKLIAVAQKQLTATPLNKAWLHYLVASHHRICRVHLSRGDASAALQAGKQSLCFAQELVAAKPESTTWLSDLAESLEDIGSAFRAQHVYPTALKYFKDALIHRRQIAIDKPNEHIHQLYLSLCLDGMGDILNDSGDRLASIQAYRESLSVAQHLAESDPSNVVWQTDLFTKQKRIGDVLCAQGNLTEALRFYQGYLQGREQLAKRHLSDVDLQRALFLGYGDMAEISENTGIDNAIVWWRKAYDQLSSMTQRGLTSRTDEEMFAFLKRKIDSSAGGVVGPPSSSAHAHVKQASDDELRTFAANAFRRCLWEAAGSAFERLLAAGDAVSDCGPQLVTCLLKSRETPLPADLARAAQLIDLLEKEGHADLAVPLRVQLSEKQVPPKKPTFWNRLFGR